MNEYKEKGMAVKLIIFSALWIVGLPLMIYVFYKLHIYFIARIISVLTIFTPIMSIVLVISIIVWIMNKFLKDKDTKHTNDSLNTQGTSDTINQSILDKEVYSTEEDSEMMREIKKLKEEIKKQNKDTEYGYADFKKALSWMNLAILMCLLEIIPIINWFLLPIAIVVLIIMFMKGTITYPKQDMVSNHNFIRLLLILTLIPFIGWWCDLIAIFSILSLKRRVKEYYYRQNK